MSDAQAAGFGDFGKWVPGFEFLQSLTKPAPSSSSPLGHWVAPTLNVEELDKRIQELKAVLFWLEQNGTALKATIQALEVQKMTLSALKGMNVSMQDMAQAFSAKPTATAAAPAAAPAAPKSEAQPAAAKARAKPNKASKASAKDRAAAASSAAMVDPMQWWGALTQQFQQIAGTDMADVQAQAAQAGAVAPGGQPAAKKPRARRAAASRKSVAPR